MRRGLWRASLMVGGVISMAAVVPPSAQTGAVSPSAPSGTRYVLAGGGSSPFNTHVSLEEHLRRAQAVLLGRAVPSVQQTLLFAGGSSEEPVVEMLLPDPPSSDLLSELAVALDREGDRNVTWRTSQLSGIQGATTRSRLKATLEEPGSSSRTVFYFAGHGYAAKGAEVTLGLWNDERLGPKELTRWLDAMEPSHRMVSVFAQCYSGAFGGIVYKQATQAEGIAPHDRCGFFAAPEDHVSSGCTPEANRPDPDDYSTWFFSALAGALPNGKPLPGSPDLDHDGRISLEEAHGFARIYDRTLDVPTVTSEYFLRAEVDELEPSEVLTLSTPFPRLIAAARPVERAVMEALATDLQVAGDPAAAVKARVEADRLDRAHEKLMNRIRGLERKQNESQERLQRSLLQRWPWLVNPFHPLVAGVLEKDGALIQQLLSEHPERKAFEQRQREIRPLRLEAGQLQRRWARWERLARGAETLILEARLREKGSPAQVSKLEALRRCEADGL